MSETVIFSIERFGRPEGPARTGWVIFVQLRGPPRDIICLGPVPNLHDAGPQPGRRRQWQVESCPRLDQTLLISSIICLSDDDGSFG